MPSSVLYPKKSFVGFPMYFGAVLGTFMAIGLVGGRIPAIYYNYSAMDNNTSSSLTTYNNALLLVSLCVLPIALYGLFWGTAYMLFRKEFTAAPGK